MHLCKPPTDSDSLVCSLFSAFIADLLCKLPVFFLFLRGDEEVLEESIKTK